MPIPRKSILRKGLSLNDQVHQILAQEDLEVETNPSDENRQRIRRAQEQYLCTEPPPFVHDCSDLPASLHDIFYDPEAFSLQGWPRMYPRTM